MPTYQRQRLAERGLFFIISGKYALLTTAFIDTAEDRARRHLIMKMTDWKSLLERYLQFQERDILPNAGSVSHEEAEAKALGEYEKYWRIQDKTLLSDFDKFIEGLK